MPLLESAILAGGALLGDGINSVSQANQNRESRAFSRAMYQRQFADNIALWNMQNSYNSPEAQMQRYRDAGLNPALIYGQSNTGGPVSTPDVARPEFRSPMWGEGLKSGALSFINAMYDLDIKQAQIDNMKAQNTVITQEALLKMEQIASTRTNTERAKFDLDFESRLASVSADARRAALKQIETNIDLTLHRDMREAVSNATSVQEAASRMATAAEQRATLRLERAKTRQEITRIRTEISRIRESTRNIRSDTRLKDLDANLKKNGIEPRDPLWARILGRFLTSYFDIDMSDSVK